MYLLFSRVHLELKALKNFFMQIVEHMIQDILLHIQSSSLNNHWTLDNIYPGIL